MRKKNYTENSEEENEFDVDEPEAIQNNASEDEWTPDKAGSGGRRTSTRLRNIPKSRAPIIDASSSDEGSESEASNKRKGKGRGRPPAKKSKVTSTSTPSTPKTISTPVKLAASDSEPSSTTAASNTTTSNNNSPTTVKVNKDFSSGAFIVLKTDAAKLEEDPPLWKIDGKALLQKYIPFDQDGQKLYKNTSVYSGWTINNKNNYFPVSVIFKQQTRKDHIVEFKRDQIKKEDLEKVEKETDNNSKNGNNKTVVDDDDEDEEEDYDENEDEENEDEENEDEENEDGEENEEEEDEEKNGDAEEVSVDEVKKEAEESDEVEVKKEKE